MIEWKQMTMQEAENKMEVLREIFDVVRLLKGSDLQAAGMERKLAGRENLCQCYAFWNKDKRCENCISLKALEEKKQTSKIEFLDSDMYQVFVRYLEIDDEPYVMEMLKKLDGWILYPSEVEFYEGETVFDVLKRVCNQAGIQMESEWTPMYNSYYVSGINNLYEFDCGKDSGWMYCVNGWYPNYGCSKYTLEDGDTVEWRYTCNLGRDVGDQYYD